MDSATRRIGALLARLTNWEKARSADHTFTLEAIRALLGQLGPWAFRPTRRAIQVGGSKGKGTTAAWVGHLGALAGLRVGVYSSPHVSSIRERIVLPKGPIAEEMMVAAVERALAASPGINPEPSAFEVLTAAAAIAFHDADLDLAVLEVGLGGRLDATTAFDVDLSILTGIELEHTAILGDTVTAIAGEKAAILRPGRVGVSGCRGVAAEVVEAHARKVGCRLLCRDRDFRIEELARDSDGSRSLALSDATGLRESVRLSDAPAFHLPALALAWAGIRVLVPGFRLPERIEAPLLPGRFEHRIDRDGELVVLDGAHTEESAGLLADEVAARWPGRRFAVLYASSRGKRWQSVLSRIAPLADQVVVTELTGTPSEDPATIVEWLLKRGTRARAVPSARDGLAALREQAAPRLITGSFHLVGELRDEVPARGESRTSDPG